ncbi:MAG: hypothetical protein CME89_12825, partial [Hirschia sp.]|nr:hypothetical protein [Hirschia sp.]
MSLDRYKTLGRSGLKVSPFCLGAMTFGVEWGFGSDAAEAISILDSYVDKGGNFVDTANIYTQGNSERILGDWFAEDATRRDKVVLATKFSGNMQPGNPNGGGASRRAIHASCDASLQRLKTDYIDLYWQHWSDPFTPIEETMSALDDLVRAGKVRYIGFSDTPAWKVAEAQTIARFRGWAPLIALQIEYSLLERTVEGDLIPMAQDMGLGITPWSPLRSGMLSGKYGRENQQAESVGRANSLARSTRWAPRARRTSGRLTRCASARKNCTRRACSRSALRCPSTCGARGVTTTLPRASGSTRRRRPSEDTYR